MFGHTRANTHTHLGLEEWPPDGERLGGLVADAAAELRAAAAM